MLRALAVATLLSTGLPAFGQNAATPKPQFEVASIKPAAPDQRGTFINMTPGGRLAVTNMPAKEMVAIAWRIQPFQILGSPGWLESARFDISAKPEDGAKQTDIRLMLQSLLAERFQLVFHRETKELPIYALVMANKNGKLGPKLVESKEGGCTPYDRNKPSPPPDPSKPPTLGCGGMMTGPDRMTASSVPVADLIPMLSRILGRTVVDKTALTAKYDISVEWTPDESQAIRFPPDGPRPPPSDPNGPNIFTALQEQLGLKLESQKGPVEVLVIDHVERPSEN